ncbi:hypothetical protein HYH03_017718 [Edaphochlamys debaryana]|uniref:NAD(P)H dehydrogenase (quinone) n=1 Tax=Edaphochlamys debaryana TaxID=47281 RepID=A0A835XLY5_9CHLO|nr:hypothetical protein HYH03_017718 [Edaphochlamys debaryana]|eukprot:KAG2483410.1 hypothetical protein HYH03_017718 [Edaphochlamys debaryana]
MLLRRSASSVVARRAVLAAPARPSRSRCLATVTSASAQPIHIAAISGSLRKGSTNTGLLRAAAKNLPEGVTFEIVDIGGLPTYNDDIWQDTNDESVIPEAIRTFRAKVLKADALLFACPEYNLGVTSALKAAIDWGYCPHGPNVFDGKAAAIVGSGGGGGTARAQTQLRTMGPNMNVYFVNGPDVALKRYENPQWFSESGDLLDPKVEGWVKNKVADLVTLARKLKA